MSENKEGEFHFETLTPEKREELLKILLEENPMARKPGDPGGEPAHPIKPSNNSQNKKNDR